MEFKEIQERAIEVQKKYNDYNERKNIRWTAREYTEGLVGDVGDLMKLIQAKSGIRKIEDVDEKLRHEIADCLWSIIVIADQLDLDLESVFMDEMDKLENRVDRGDGDVKVKEEV
jgi:NTP pyrophosphatase (non-canonical NTP hydrolase)